MYGLGKVAVTEHANLKAGNKKFNGLPVPTGCRQTQVTHCSIVIAISALRHPNIMTRKNITTFCGFLEILQRFFLVLFKSHMAVTVIVPECELSIR